MTTRSSTAGEDHSLWSGRFHFLVKPECKIEYLQGRMGGYVSAIGSANSKEEFIERAFDALQRRELTADEEFDEVENISTKYYGGTLSDEWMALCESAVETGDVAFNCFDLYAST